MGARTKGETAIDLRGCHGWDAPPVIRRNLLALAACITLAACTSSSPDVVAGDQPIADPSGPTGAGVVVPKPPLLPEGVDVLAVPAERMIPVWKHPKSADATFALDTQNPTGSFSPMLIEGAKRRAGEAWYHVLLPLRPNGSAAWVRESDVDLRRIDQRIEVDLSDRTLRYYVHDDLSRHLLRLGQDPLRDPVPAIRDRGARPLGLLARAVGVAGRRPHGDPWDFEPE